MSSQWSNILNFLMYLGTSLPILALGIYLFMLTTPYKEHEIIADGGCVTDPCKVAAAQACAWDIGGKIFGLSLVLASAVFHSVSLADLAIWGLIGIVFQIIVFYLFEWVTPFTVIKEIPRGNVAVGIFSAFISLSTGLILAALISY